MSSAVLSLGSIKSRLEVKLPVPLASGQGERASATERRMMCSKAWRPRLIALALAAAASVPISAAGPSIIMIYGGPLAQPIFIVQKTVDDLRRYAFLWCGNGGSRVPAEELAHRQHLSLAIFWIAEAWTDEAAAQRLTKTLRPEDAAQHGRLYLPAGERSAVTVVTGFPRNPGRTLEDQERRRVPTTDTEFVSACSVSAGDLAIAGLGLNPSVPQGNRTKYGHIRDAKDWRNPWISVLADGIEVVSPALPGGRKRLPAAELRALLISFPESAWPYGRVIAAADSGLRGGRRDDELIHQNHLLVDSILSTLGVTVDWWPPP
jgi:hypothetical protein